jgi:hypothetical protein
MNANVIPILTSPTEASGYSWAWNFHSDAQASETELKHEVEF